MKYICTEKFAFSIDGRLGFINEGSVWKVIEEEKENDCEDYYDDDEYDSVDEDYWDDTYEEDIINLELVSDNQNDSSFNRIYMPEYNIEDYFKLLGDSDKLFIEELRLGQTVCVKTDDSTFRKGRFLGYGDYGQLGYGEHDSGINSYCIEVFKNSGSSIKFFKEVYPTEKYDEYLKDIDALKEKAYVVANNAIYFNDNADYLSALYEVCKILDPGNEDVGERYITMD